MENQEKLHLHESLNEVAIEFWKNRGANFGKHQTIKDFKIDNTMASLPSKFKSDTVFVTKNASVEVGGYNGRKIILALWVSPILKNGLEGQHIRLSWISL